MDNLVGLHLDTVLEMLKGYDIKLIEIESPKVKYEDKRAIRIQRTCDAEQPCLEITFTGFPVLSD